MTRKSPVKCVVWDIDNTLLTGTYLESADRPPGADPAMTAVLAELGGRGILHALASKNPPEAAAHTARVTGWRFAATECGWGSKSGALARIAATLGIAVDALAFVDDDPYERAEVGSALPGVLVLSPEEAAEAAGWPEFSPPVITAEARRRGEMYAERQRRQAAQRSFGGTREEFLESAGTQVTIAAATPADVPRLHELAARTRQFNSAGVGMTEDWFRRMLAARDRCVVTVRLRDAFGDDGVVGGCVIAQAAEGAGDAAYSGDAGDARDLGDTGDAAYSADTADAADLGDAAGAPDAAGAGTWTVPLLMMSCRAMGRGVIDALLAWLVRQAARSGAGGLRIPCVTNGNNVPLRLALAAAGFRAPEAGAAYQRDLGTPPPGLPRWVSAPGEQGGERRVTPPAPADVAAVADDLRAFLASATRRDELLHLPATAALFGGAVGLDSLTGTLLLREIHRRFGSTWRART